MGSNSTDERYRVKVSQNTNTHVKPWRVTDFIEKVNNAYYKKEILNEIEERLKKGVNPANIIMFDKSFNIYKAYRGLDTLNLNTVIGVKNFYHLGKPFSLYPNQKIILTNYIFNMFSELYTLFNKYDIRIDKSILHSLINQTSEKELDLSDLYVELDLCYERLDKDKKFIDELKEKVEKEIKELRTKEKEERKNIIKYLRFEKSVKSESSFIEKLKNNEYKRLHRIFPKKFENNFIALTRPVAGIYDEENNTIEILGINFIKKNGNDNKQIDLKSVTHNSPFTIILIGGFTLLASLYQMHCNKYDENAIKKDKEGDYSTLQGFNFDDEDEVDVIEREISEGDVLIKRWEQKKRELESVMQEEAIQEVKESETLEATSISDVAPSVKVTINSMNKKVQNYFDKAFENNDFKEGELEVTKEETIENLIVS